MTKGGSLGFVFSPSGIERKVRAVDVQEPEGSSSLMGLSSFPQAGRLIPFWPPDHSRWLLLGVRQGNLSARQNPERDSGWEHERK